MPDTETFTPSAGESRPTRPRLPMRRVVVRFGVMLLALVAVDAAVRAFAPQPHIGSDWRLPRTMPTSEITPAVRRLDELAEGPQPVVAFVGASPTWGDAVRQASDTVPARFAAAARADGSAVRVVNLASNGQLPADEYFVALRAAESADVVFVQLTYHSFNPAWRLGVLQRYPELPGALGVPVDAALAEALHLAPTQRPDVTGAVDRWLRDRWELYGARDRIAARAFGSSPESRVFAAWERLSDPAFAGEEARVSTGLPFDELDPDQQMFVLDEFSGAADFRLRASDAEAVVLDRLAAALAARRVNAVFYLSPLNLHALEENDLADPQSFAANSATLRSIVERHGMRFLDLNDAQLPSRAFADINHTTAAGSDRVGGLLWNETADTVRTR